MKQGYKEDIQYDSFKGLIGIFFNSLLNQSVKVLKKSNIDFFIGKIEIKVVHLPHQK